MKRRLIIDGNAVYELDEDCMLKKRLDKGKEKREGQLVKKQTERQKKKKWISRDKKGQMSLRGRQKYGWNEQKSNEKTVKNRWNAKKE